MPGCGTDPKGRLFCGPHWGIIPWDLKREFLAATNGSTEKRAIYRKILKWASGEPAAPAATERTGAPSRQEVAP